MSSENKPAPGTTVYRASGVPTYHENRVNWWINFGTVTPCGEWVDVGEARYQLTSEWRTRRVDAEADVADVIEATGRRYIAQAHELRRRAAE